jgi:hypothetical protein
MNGVLGTHTAAAAALGAGGERTDDEPAPRTAHAASVVSLVATLGWMARS